MRSGWLSSASVLEGVATATWVTSPGLWWEVGRRDGLSAEGKGNQKQKPYALTLAVFKTRPGILAFESHGMPFLREKWL